MNYQTSLIKYEAILKKNILTLNYDKNKTQLKQILNQLNSLNLSFNEINIQESDLEDIFLELTKNNNISFKI